MLFNLKKMVLAGVLCSLAAPVLAEDVALVIGNSSYDNQPYIRSAKLSPASADALRAEGFFVVQGQNLNRDEQFALVSKFFDSLDEADRVVVVLAGHIASSARDSWLLATDADDPDIFTAGHVGLSIGAIMDAAGQKPGRAIVMLATDGTPTLGYGLGAGLGNLDIPQGVTVIHGPMADLVPLLEDGFLDPENSIREAIQGASQHIIADGFLPDSMTFVSGESEIVAPDALPSVDDADQTYWDAVQGIGTIEALQSYVERYPQGQYALQAKQMITTLLARPAAQAKAAEADLKLNRDQRRQIQRNLSILGFDPRGIDGLFGRGSRGAIGAWQQSRGIEGFGYLSGNQIAALQTSADIRSQELEEEARRRQEEEDRQDTEYWRDTGRDGTETSLRAYLKRYPDGLYSELAQTRVDQFDEDRRAQAAAVEREYWDSVQSVGTADAYRQYLQEYPSGAFASTAKGHLEQLEGAVRDEELIRRARADESRVAGNTIARLLVEKKLQALGLKPGRVDGKFDDKTRRAVRKFQRARQIPVTGYVTQQTIVQLLAAR